MKHLRRRFLHLAAGAALLPAVSRLARAQTYPSRPVRIIVGLPAGGGADILARLMGQWLSERLGQPFVVENRPGASGNIALDAAVRAPADGLTIHWTIATNAINASLYEKVNVQLTRDMAPVVSVIRVPNVMQVHPSVPARSVPEFIAYAKAHPGKINYASGGNATPHHVAGELFKLMASVTIVHIPYRGSTPAHVDFLAGQVQVMFDSVTASIAYLRSGQLRPLATTTATRLDVLPDIPTLGEFLPGYEASGWHGIGVRRNTPPEIIETINREINAALADPKVRARMVDLGGAPLGGSPAAFGKLMTDDIEKWTKVVKFAGIKTE